MTADAPSPAGTGQAVLSEARVPALAAGATLLGSGGGGEVATGALLLRGQLAGAPVPLVAAARLPAGTLVVHVGLVGAPDVLSERLVEPGDFARAVHAVADAAGAPAGAVGVIEVGGLNALIPVLAAGRLRLPLVDGDLMGRAFPRIDQTVAGLHGLHPQPFALVGPAGDTVVVPDCTPRLAEPLVRANVLALGGAAALALHPVTAVRLAEVGVTGSLSACLDLGERFLASAGAAPEELAAGLGGELLALGRIEEIVPRHGQTPGSMTLTDRRTGAVVRVDLLDEYLAVTVDGVTRVSSPDIIAAVDPSGHRPLRTDQVRAGQTLMLLRLPALYDWPPEAAALVGPAAFGLDPEPARPGGAVDGASSAAAGRDAVDGPAAPAPSVERRPR
ncbi:MULTISPECIES: DUF917 family protein [unclassified Streptomyces]|uniref:S-methyl thiohydantoin desulfurase domain-containing protein n=1 Tax=unclassified Streptomyces TaxID=2593676 RepID=UPI0036E60A21